MAYRFKMKETIGDGARRIALEQISEARQELTRGEISRDEAVHQARKRFKKLRGLIRLMRPAMDNSYAQENAWYRDTARLLSPARDAAVLVETFDAVRQHFAHQLKPDAFEPARQTLVARREASAGEGQALEDRVQEVVANLEQAMERVAHWPLEGCEFKSIRKGLEQVYAQGRTRFKDAYEELTAESLHEWRKSAKYHWYHTRLLEAIWPELMKAHAKLLSKLADELGELHDLAVLRQTLLDEPEAFGSAEDLQVLVALLDDLMAQHAARAYPMGQRLYAEKPEAHSRRIQRYWQAAKASEQG